MLSSACVVSLTVLSSANFEDVREQKAAAYSAGHSPHLEPEVLQKGPLDTVGAAQRISAFRSLYDQKCF